MRMQAMAEWTEGVMGDGAVILKDGQPVLVDQVVAHIAGLEASLCELLDAFNPDRIDNPGMIWGRAAIAERGPPLTKSTV